MPATDISHRLYVEASFDGRLLVSCTSCDYEKVPQASRIMAGDLVAWTDMHHADLMH